MLLRGQELVALTPKAFDILLTLLESAGRVVPKDDLMKKVWPNTFVEEGNLTQNVSLLRKALGETASGPQFIETVPRRGYRFVAPVSKTSGNGENSSANTVAISSLASEAALPAPQNQPDVNRRPPASAVGLRTRVSKRVAAVAFTLAAVVAVVAGIAYLSTRNKAGAAPTTIQSIAVLPFVDENPNADTQFLDDEIADSLVNSLTKRLSADYADFADSIRQHCSV